MNNDFCIQKSLFSMRVQLFKNISISILKLFCLSDNLSRQFFCYELYFSKHNNKKIRYKMDKIIQTYKLY